MWSGRDSDPPPVCSTDLVLSLSQAERRQPVPRRAQLGAGPEHQERQDPVWALLPWPVGGSPDLHEEQPESQVLVRFLQNVL